MLYYNNNDTFLKSLLKANKICTLTKTRERDIVRKPWNMSKKLTQVNNEKLIAQVEMKEQEILIEGS